MKFKRWALASLVDSSCGRFLSVRGIPSNKSLVLSDELGREDEVRYGLLVFMTTWAYWRIGLVYPMEVSSEWYVSRYDLSYDAGVLS